MDKIDRDNLEFDTKYKQEGENSLREILFNLDTKFYVIDINSLDIIEHNDVDLIKNKKKCYELFRCNGKDTQNKCEDCVIDDIVKTKASVTREIERVIRGKKRIFKLILKPIFNDRNEIDRILIEYYDITATKRYLEELKDSEAKYRSVVSQTADNIYLMDLETYKIIEANQSLLSMLEYTEAEIKKMSVFDFIVDNKNNILGLVERLKIVDKMFLPHRQYRTRTGKIIDVEVSASIINYGGKRVVCVISRNIMNRIASQKALEEARNKLKIANEYKSSIISNISHEMRTPLTTILGFSKILYEEIPQEDYRAMIQMIEKSGKRLEKTLISLLTLSELETKDFELNLNDIRLVDIIRTATVLFEEYLIGHNIYLMESINDYRISIRADEQLIYQILYHLIDNAIKYTERGYIKIEADSFVEEGQLYAVIRVKDTGIGIPEEQLEMIFNAFQKGDSGLGKNLEGIGIGLTLVKKMVEVLGGRIYVESKPNVGSVFSIVFPGFREVAEY